MKNWAELVAEFHEARGDVPNNLKYFDLTRDVEMLRVKLIAEEFAELVGAMHAYNQTEILDALCDLTYVVLGTVVACGMLPVFDEAFREVHRSNLTKDHKAIAAGQKYGPTGKGAGYQPADLEAILTKYLGNRPME